MEERFKLETQRLKNSWMRHNHSLLQDYLVQDVQDPRINVQSILTRHFLINHLSPRQFADLMEHEIRFALVVNWLISLLNASVLPQQLHAILDALLDGQNNAEGLDVPRFVSQTFSTLALPNYICDLFTWAPVETTDAPIPEYLMETFQAIWHQLLETEHPKRISVLEPACGSANDYRFIDSYGIARLLNYTGLDLCQKNIDNAKHTFPNVRFDVGNVLEIHRPDNAFDLCFVHDLFEHLSVEAMELAICEVCRVTRQKLCVGFFNMHHGKQHMINPIADYYCNKLSAPTTKALFERYASKADVIHIDSFLLSHFGCDLTHNKAAYTFIITI